MFSTREYLQKKTGSYGIGRFSYLQSLVTEFQDSDSEGAKLEVLANLANFSYDPINYEHIRQLNIIDLFLDCLDEANTSMVEFAIGGLCNLSLDKENKDYILRNNGVKLVTTCLTSSNEETVLSGITTLMFLTTPASKPDISSLPIVDAMLKFSKSSNPRISNLAHIFLQDYCSSRQVAQAATAQKQWDDQVQAQAEMVLQGKPKS